MNEIIDAVNITKEESMTMKAEMEEVRKEITTKAETEEVRKEVRKEMTATKEEVTAEMKEMIKEEVTAIRQGIQKETRETKEAQRKGSDQTRERREMARVPDEGDAHGSERSKPHLHSPNILKQPAEESEREATRTAARAEEAHTAAESEKAMQAWDTTVTTMARLDSPATVASAVAAAIQLPARVWNFEAPARTQLRR